MSRGTLACLLSDSNFKVRPFSVCSSDTLLACALASVGQFLRLWFFKEGFSVEAGVFLFPVLLVFFPSFCQALAEDRVTKGPCNNPHQKKKKKKMRENSQIPNWATLPLSHKPLWCWEKYANHITTRVHGMCMFCLFRAYMAVQLPFFWI